MPTAQIRYRIFGRDGTVDHVQMRDLIRRGEVTPLSDIAPEESEQWQAAGSRAELQRYFALVASEHPPAPGPSTGFDRNRVIAVVLIVAGFVFAISSLRDFLNGIASSRWPVTEARLIYAQYVNETPWWSYIPSRRSRRLNQRRVSRLYVGYEYFVNGQKYHSNGIAFGSELDSAAHQRYRFQYAKPLLAHYDPAVPGRAVLDAGVTFGSAGTLLCGAIVMVVGGVAFVRRGANFLATSQ